MKNSKYLQSTTRVSSLVFFFILTSLLACKKDSDPSPTGVAGSWQITAINIVPAFSGISDYLAVFTLTGDTCPSQTTFNFKANNTIEITAPATCTSTKNELANLIGVDGTTTWKEENGQLILTTGSSVRKVNLSVDASTMSLAAPDIDLGDNVKHTITFVFKRK
jgi:hypothetical protein